MVWPTHVNVVVPGGPVHGLVVQKDGAVVLSLQLRHATVKTLGALVEEHL